MIHASRFLTVTLALISLNLIGIVTPTPAPAQSTDVEVSGTPAPETPDGPRVDRSGDPLPRGVIHRFGTARFRHGGGARSAPQAISPDGRTIAVLTPRGCRLFDLKSGKEEVFCPLPTGVEYQELSTLDFAPDGKLLAMIKVTEGDCVIWDPATGKMVRRLYGFVKRWMEIAISNPSAAENAKLVIGLGFSEDAKSLVAWTFENKVCFLDVATDQVTPELEVDNFRLLNASADRKTLVGISEKTKQIQVLDVPTRKSKGVIEAAVQSDTAGVSPDGKLVAMRADADIGIFESTGKALRTLYGKHPVGPRENSVSDLVFTLGGKFLLAPTHEGEILRWDLSTGKQLSSLGSPAEAGVQVNPHPDGKTLVSLARDGVIRRRNLETGEELPTGDGYVGAVRAMFSPDGTSVIVTDDAGRFDVWDVESGKQLYSPGGKERRQRYVGVAKEGMIAIIHTPSDEVSIRELPSWKEKRSFRLRVNGNSTGESVSRTVAVSPDGKRGLVSGLPVGTELFDTLSGKALCRLHDATYVFAGDGSAIFAATVDDLSCLETETGKVRWVCHYARNALGAIDLSNSRTVTGIDISPDGRRLAVGLADGTIRLIDTATGKETTQLQVRKSSLDWTVSFSPDGKWLLYSGHNGEPRILDLATREELFRFTASHDSWEAQFHPDGKRALTVQANQTVLVWDLRPDEIPAAKDDPERVWTDLASRGGITAYRAIWSLIDDPAAAVDMLKRKVSPAPPPLNGDAVLMLIAKLNDDDFATRERVSKQLVAEGRDILPLLQERWKNSQLPEQRRRLEEIMGHITSGPSTPEEWRILRAVQALEMGGSAEGRKLLQEWTTGRKGALLTEQARDAVARMTK